MSQPRVLHIALLLQKQQHGGLAKRARLSIQVVHVCRELPVEQAQQLNWYQKNKTILFSFL
jgi:hypothetical protein